MAKNVKIAPSMLSADFSAMGDELERVIKAGADVIHLDVMDGVFVPNITFGIKMVRDLKKRAEGKPLDCHLMIVSPEKYVKKFAEAGADYITVHYEACKENLAEVLKSIKQCGVKCGLVINPDTPVEKIEKDIPLCDMVLVMSVFPGFGGQKFIEDVLPKIAEVKKLVEATGKDIDIEIDGGITRDNVKAVKLAGANVIVAGSTVFNEKDRAAVIKYLREV